MLVAASRPDDLDSAWALRIADHADRMTAAPEFRAYRGGKAALYRQRIIAVTAPDWLLAGDI